MTAVRHMTAKQYGVLQAIYYLVVVATEVPSGILADRLGRKTALILGALMNAAGAFTFALAGSFFEFAAGEVLFGLGTALISGADSALLYDSLAAHHREAEYPRAEGAAQTIWLLVTALGFPLTDLFLVRTNGGVQDPVLAYWFTGALSMVGLACALGMQEPPMKRRLSTREITVGALRDVVHIPGMLRLIAYSVGVFVLLRAAVVSFFNPVLTANEIPVDNFGLVLAATNVVGAGTVYLMPRLMKRYGERVFMAAMPVSLVVMFALLMVVRAQAAAALFCIQGAMFGVYPLLMRTLLNRLVPSPERRATILSIESMLCRVAFALVVVWSGWALDVWGLNLAMATTALMGCIPLVIAPLFSKGAAANR